MKKKNQKQAIATRRALYAKLMAEARKFNDTLDAVDIKNGGGPPAEQQIDLALRTVMSALESAVNRKCWRTVCEAQCMLQDIEVRRRPAELGKARFLEPT